MMSVTLYAATLESLQVTIETSSDPTLTPPYFNLTAAAAKTPGSWSVGAWDGAWDSSTGYAAAITPQFGTGGLLTIASGNVYLLWVKVNLGSEVAVWPVGQVKVP